MKIIYIAFDQVGKINAILKTRKNGMINDNLERMPMEFNVFFMIKKFSFIFFFSMPFYLPINLEDGLM